MFLSLFILPFLICSLKKGKKVYILNTFYKNDNIATVRESNIVEVLQVLYCLTLKIH